MASTKRSALATGFTVDLTALHQYNTTNFVEYARHEHQAASNKRQAPSSSSNKQQASSCEQQASSAKPQAASSSILLPS
jgi:hypothetical protein